MRLLSGTEEESILLSWDLVTPVAALLEAIRNSDTSPWAIYVSERGIWAAPAPANVVISSGRPCYI